MTTGNIVKLAQKGEDPHAIMIPYDFRYPLEKICIKNAYSQFNSWGENKIVSTYWYKYPNEGYVY
jgi:LruC domain-containing protein